MNNQYKILIVDDDKAVGNLLKEYFKSQEYAVDTSLSAVEALEKVKNTKYHIVMIDIEMPQMEGIELLKRLKKYDPMTQIVMMTESSTIDKILRSLEYGANDYIIKPFKSEDSVLTMIDHSVKKLERWRDAFIQIVQ